MFICQKCKQQQPSHVSPVRKVTAVYSRSYSCPDGTQSSGTEVAKELDMCGGCAALIGEPEVVGARDGSRPRPHADDDRPLTPLVGLSAAAASPAEQERTASSRQAAAPRQASRPT